MAIPIEVRIKKSTKRLDVLDTRFEDFNKEVELLKGDMKEIEQQITILTKNWITLIKTERELVIQTIKARE